jgi:hypothetical protein
MGYYYVLMKITGIIKLDNVGDPTQWDIVESVEKLTTFKWYE